MLPIAEWVMRGRSHAIAFVLLMFFSSMLLIAWPNIILGAAAISLVWLRQGEKEGLLLGFWALLPCVVIIALLQNPLQLLLLLVVGISSYVLRRTVSLHWALLTTAASSFVAVLIMNHIAAEQFALIADTLNQWVSNFESQLQQQSNQASKLQVTKIEGSYIAGTVGILLATSSFMSLALARSWQAKLYNPGGFQQEFHRLRFSKYEALILVLLAGGLSLISEQYITWGWVVIFPLCVGGIALFHAWALAKKLTIHWYVMFYAVLFLFSQVLIQLLTLFAVIDAVADIRSKIEKTHTDSES